MPDCPHCQSPNPDEAQFCGNCGYLLGSAAGAASSAAVVCPSCGASVPARAQFCPSCGYQVGGVAGNYRVVGRRIVGGLIDLIPLTVLFIFMAATLGEFGSSDGGNFEVRLENEEFLLYVILFFGYYIVSEALTGSTPGKMIMGLMVVKVNGQPYNIGAVLIRNLLRFIDGLFFYIVGIIFIAVAQKNQRLGDLAAGTIVIEGRATPRS